MANDNKKNTVKKPKVKQKHAIVKICLHAGMNNSIITLTDLKGNVLGWSSGGNMGFKGTKKSSPFAAQKATESILQKVKSFDTSTVHLTIKGVGMARDPFLRAIQSSGLQIETIKDLTGFGFGGVKAKNRRRV